MAVRQVAYLRAVVSDKPVARTFTQQNDVAGRLVAQRDPRFSSAATRPNQTTLYSLSGAALLTDSVDAGWRLSLTGETGQVLEQWDGRGSHWQNEYDDLRRPIALHEYALGVGLRTVERLTYADNSAEFAERNQCGSLIRHDDSAGTVWFRQVALNGGLACQTRRFLPDQAGVSANWPANEVDRDLLLQPGEGYTSESRYGPSGEVLEQIDAGGHLQQFKFDRAGQLQRIDLTLKGQALQPLLRAADYNAAGQLLTQITGNNVTSVASYQPENGRLECLTATTSTRRRLQELSYEYDPVGNILRLVDHTQADSYFDNQRMAAENAYTYDSLNQLTSAKGRETAGAGQNPGLPELNIPSPIDPARLLNYSEYYEYDAGGNRTLLRHESDKNPFSRLMYVDPQSNRALPWNEGEDVPDFSRHFDANGNLQYLASGTQPIIWDARNQLQCVINVQRSTGINDGEWYRYNAAGERAVKFSTRQARTVTHQDVVHYLPGLEVRTDGEELQVIHVQLARGSVRCLHWVKGPPDGIDNGQLRYSIDDHLGSSCLELDQQASVVSHEGYYPYGGTAWWAARSKVDADYKTIRYSGKERDASGLYYYGARYYAGWLGRWINPDPIGSNNGLNLYRFCGNNPICRIDPDGRMWRPYDDEVIEDFVMIESDVRAAYGLPPIDLQRSDQDGDESMDYQGSSESPESNRSLSESGSDDENSPASPPAPTDDQNTLLEILNADPYQPAHYWNSANLLERTDFGGKVYRADRRGPEEVLRHGFKASEEFTAVGKMISGDALIVAETIKGAIFYAAQGGDTYNFYEIDATNVSGVSLLENMVLNNSIMVEHLNAHPGESPSNQTGEANRMHEAHLNHDDLINSRSSVVSLGKLTDELEQMRRNMNR
jgi:insecticidal toxin complex protein TccC